MMPPDAFLEQVRARALAELERAPVARAWWKDAALLAGVNLAVAALCAVGVGGKGLVLNQSPSLLVAVVGLPMVLMLLVGAVVAVMPLRKAPRGATALAALGVVASGLAALVVLGGSGLQDSTRGLLAAGLPCLTTELVVSVVPVGAAVVVLSRFAHCPWRMLAGGLAAGGAGLFVLHLHCPIGGMLHLAAFHVVPWLVVAGGAMLIRARVRSRSFAP